mmetsp:Transcript_30084/g.22345  ORF Transcript_30084/g.22345 Transcript_30084/m.22345 type:complete len:93 (-) Transcript_30084:68-346(-)
MRHLDIHGNSNPSNSDPPINPGSLPVGNLLFTLFTKYVLVHEDASLPEEVHIPGPDGPGGGPFQEREAPNRRREATRPRSSRNRQQRWPYLK